MMRAPRALAAAVRRPDGQIAVATWPYQPITDRLRFLKLPILRGGVILVESLVLGMRALSWSADQAAESEGPRDEAQAKKDQRAIAGTLVFSFVLGIAFFVALPHLLTAGILWLLGLDIGADHPLFHAVDGGVKLCLFLAYLAVIGRMDDVKRLFQYHGAEHKSIYAWEGGEALTVDAVRRWTRFHPRCGTSFLLFVVLASILVFTPVFALLPPLPIQSTVLKNLAQVLIKIPLMLPVAGLAYEAIRLSARFYDVPVLRALLMPGLWLQRLTTREPDDAQLEVAIRSLEAAFEASAALAQDDLGLEGAAFKTGAAVVPSAGA